MHHTCWEIASPVAFQRKTRNMNNLKSYQNNARRKRYIAYQTNPSSDSSVILMCLWSNGQLQGRMEQRKGRIASLLKIIYLQNYNEIVDVRNILIARLPILWLKSKLLSYSTVLNYLSNSKLLPIFLSRILILACLSNFSYTTNRFLWQGPHQNVTTIPCSTHSIRA